MTVVIPDPVQYSIWIELSFCDLRPDARFHSDEEIDGVAKSMAVKQLQSIAVCRVADPANTGRYRYEVIFGVGRVQAARKNGWEKIRADIYEGLTEFQKLDMIFAENEDRKNASPLYQAKVLKAMQENEGQPLTQDELSEKIGKARSTIGIYLGLFELSPKIWDNANTLAKFGIRHFIQLLRIKDKDTQWKLAETARDKDLSSSDLGALVDKELGVKTGTKKTGRPKGDKNVGGDGFAFKRIKGDIIIKGRFAEEKGIALFLAKAGEAWTQWSSQNPKPKTRAGSKTSASEEISPTSATAPAPAQKATT